MRIIAYTYDADVHCPDCAKYDVGMRRLVLPHPVPVSSLDEHGLSDQLLDRERNPIHPVFDIDETSADLRAEDGGGPLACGDCHTTIREWYYAPQET
jgi:hypothetical protein